MKRVFLAGEGPNDLGDWYAESPYQPKTARERKGARRGVIEALLRRVREHGWEVAGAIPWKSIRKLRVNRPGHADRHNVLAAAQHAKEIGCDVLAFARDRDGDVARGSAIQEGVQAASEQHKGALSVVGAPAVEKLEGWLTALLGRPRSEESRHPETWLRERGMDPKNTAAFVKIVEEADLAAIPLDAESLLDWLAAARAVLSPPE